MAKNVHVIRHDKRWAVKGEGNERAKSVHNTQAEAIKAARNIAKNRHSEVIIHRADGRVRERDSYSSAPLPPKAPRKVLFPKAHLVVGVKKIRRAVDEVMHESHGKYPERIRE
jgi:hypothetical protein